MFPDPEALVIAYLKPLITPTPVSTKVPAQRPAKFVRVTRTGGTMRSVSHDDARVTVECWADNSVEAADLARTAEKHLCAMDVPGGHVPQGPPGWVGRPAYLEDPITGIPRYVMTCVVRTRRLP